MIETAGDNDRSRVLVRLTNGRMVSVEAVSSFGDYAVHPWVTPVLVAQQNGFTVTHRPSGLSIWSVRTYVEALRVANHLNDSNALPADPLALEHLLQEAHVVPASDTMKKFTALRAELEKIAPRIVPPKAQQWNVGAVT